MSDQACPGCGGLGQKLVTEVDGDGRVRVETVVCPTCGGKGTVRG